MLWAARYFALLLHRWHSVWHRKPLVPGSNLTWGQILFVSRFLFLKNRYSSARSFFATIFFFSTVPSYYKLRRTNLPSTQVEKHTRKKLYKVAVMCCIKYWSATAVQLLPTFYPVPNLLCIIRTKWYRVRVMPKRPMRHSRCSNIVRVGICIYSIRQTYPVASISTLRLINDGPEWSALFFVKVI